jgi:hypothetical protein
LNQSNWLRTLFVHSSCWNRVENAGSELEYGVKKEEEYFEGIFTSKYKKLNEKLKQEPGTTILSLSKKTIIVILIPLYHFPTVKGMLTGL